MRYPVGRPGNTLDPLWYNAQPFGAKTSYGYHEGDDFNLRTGGNTDLGKSVYAVADGKIVYYHNSSHPTTGFGRHMVLECDTPKGKRWYHYAHCHEITTQVKTVKEGDVIGKLGNSGTQWAHLHFAVFKVNPSTLYKGIDSIAANSTNLNKWWEKFEVQSGAGSPPDMSKELQACLKDRESFWKQRDAALEQVKQLQTELATEKDRNKGLTREYQEFIREIVGKLKPASVLPDITDRHYAIQLIEELINSESALQKSLKEKENELSQKESAWESERQELKQDIQQLEKEVNNVVEKYESEIQTLRKRIEQLKKGIDDSNEDKEEINSIKAFIEAIRKLFFRK